MRLPAEWPSLPKMKFWHFTGLLLVTVWGCSAAIVDDPAGASGNAGRASGGAAGDTIEPAGGSDSTGGRAAAGASGAGEAGVGGTSGAGGAGGAGGEANCDFGPRQAPETCLGAVEVAFEGDVAAECAGSSATLEQLVGAWVYSPFWDADETLELAADGTASYSTFWHSSPDLRDQSVTTATGTFELLETSIEFKVTEWTFQYFTTKDITRHEAVSEAHHLWYRYDAASDTLNLAECGSPIGSYKRQ